jgi:hypothetical protein
MAKPKLRAVPGPEDVLSPQAQVADPAEEEEGEEEDEGEDDEETLVESWTTDNEELLIELHSGQPDEVLAIGGAEEEGGESPVVALAFGIAELDELLNILSEVRESMARRAKMRRKGKL